MLFKLSVSSLRKSLRDYAIYFFTLVLGVSIFYVFNAVSTQVAFLDLLKSPEHLVQLFKTVFSAVSVLVAIILGLLIVYASRFIMKRRHKEFALYMTLGMSRSKISILLLIETILISIGSIAVGLLLGVGLSQLMSAVVANLFDADMSKYQFTISGAAISKTIIYFAIIYLVVMVFQILIISRLKLIDLINSGKKSEQIKLRNPIWCIIVFILAAIILGFVYYKINHNMEEIMLEFNQILIYLSGIAIATFLIFWSLAGLILRVVSSRKKMYFKKLNSFTFRQISSKINTMVVSMTLICLMLFITMLTISTGFAIKSYNNMEMEQITQSDIQMSVYDMQKTPEDKVDISKIDIGKKLNENGIDISSYLKSYLFFNTYQDNEKVKIAQDVEISKTIIKLSDYNALMKMYDKKQLTLSEGEFAFFCPSDSDNPLKGQKELTFWGHTLHAFNGNKQWVSVIMFGMPYYVVPDSVVDESSALEPYFVGMYKGDKKDTERRLNKYMDEKMPGGYLAIDEIQGHRVDLNFQTRLGVAQDNIVNKAFPVLVVIYLGLVFLIACGAILALKELSENIDNVERYKMLRKIGVEEKDISMSLFKQIGFFFVAPLLIACMHLMFSIRYIAFVLNKYEMQSLAKPIFINSLIVLLVYGGYFLITYLCSKSIIRNRK